MSSDTSPQSPRGRGRRVPSGGGALHFFSKENSVTPFTHTPFFSDPNSDGAIGFHMLGMGVNIMRLKEEDGGGGAGGERREASIARPTSGHSNPPRPAPLVHANVDCG